MNTLERAGIWIVIGAVLLLSLYELADYTEVFQHDESLVLPGLLLLIIGMAMLALKVLRKAFINLLHTLTRRDGACKRPRTAWNLEPRLSFRPPPLTPPIVLASLRI